ncbi:MAG: hypothetical protein AAFR94_07675, partial [Pseudomonadota bacterium]
MGWMPAIICTAVAAACLSLGPSQASAAPDCDWGYSITVDVQAGPSGFAQEARIDLASGDFPTGYVMTPAGDVDGMTERCKRGFGGGFGEGGVDVDRAGNVFKNSAHF